MHSTLKLPAPEVYIPKKKSSRNLHGEVILEEFVEYSSSHKAKSDAWKPPQTWKSPTGERAITRLQPPPRAIERTAAEQRSRTIGQSQPQAPLAMLQKNIQRMVAASPKIVLERLTEDWSESTTDASLLNELEFEKQLWMLAELQPPDKKMLPRAATEDRGVNSSVSVGRKIRSLYEDHGMLFYCISLYPLHSRQRDVVAETCLRPFQS